MPNRRQRRAAIFGQKGPKEMAGIPPNPTNQTSEEKLKDILNSPKGAGIVLAIGSILWRLVAAWSNVDFILSIREERIAVILEAVLDWGWVVILIAAVIWAIAAPKDRTDKTSMSWGMAITAGVLCFMGGILVTTGTASSMPAILNQWTTGPGGGCGGVVDSTKLIGWKNKYRIILVCGVTDDRIDPRDNDKISLSKPFTITGQPISIAVDGGGMQDAINQMPVGASAFMWHTIALVPLDEDMSEIKRLSDITRHGGLLASPAGAYMSGFSKLPQGSVQPQQSTAPKVM
jgi:hypothetical protein